MLVERGNKREHGWLILGRTFSIFLPFFPESWKDGISPIVVTFRIKPFSTSMIMGETVKGADEESSIEKDEG